MTQHSTASVRASAGCLSQTQGCLPTGSTRHTNNLDVQNLQVQTYMLSQQLLWEVVHAQPPSDKEGKLLPYSHGSHRG